MPLHTAEERRFKADRRESGSQSVGAAELHFIARVRLDRRGAAGASDSGDRQIGARDKQLKAEKAISGRANYDSPFISSPANLAVDI